MFSLLLTTSLVGCGGGEPEVETLQGTCNYADSVCNVTTPEGPHSVTINNNRVALTVNEDDDAGRFIFPSDATVIAIEAARQEYADDEEALAQALGEIDVWVWVAVEEEDGRLTDVEIGQLHLDSVEALLQALAEADDDDKKVTSLTFESHYHVELTEPEEEDENNEE